MIIATVVFGDQIYDRMARVLEYSVAENCPSAEFVRIDAPPHKHINGIPDHCPANMHKKQFWSDFVHNHHGEDIVLLDCDTVVLGDLSEVFERDFDLAYTVRRHKARINAGVMFCRSNQTVRRFFDKWMYLQAVLISEEERPHLMARLQEYAGLDQAALTLSLDRVDWPLNTLELPCEIYNNVDQTWHLISEATKILHVKGKLRRFTLLTDRPPEKHELIGNAMRVWRDLESRSLAAT